MRARTQARPVVAALGCLLARGHLKVATGPFINDLLPVNRADLVSSASKSSEASGIPLAAAPSYSLGDGFLQVVWFPLT